VITSVSQAWRTAGRQGPRAPRVVPGLGDLEHAGRDLDAVALLNHSGDCLEPAFWGHHLFQQVVRQSGGGELGFELRDATACCSQFVELFGSQTRGAHRGR